MTSPTPFELMCSSAVASFRAALALADAEPHPEAAREQLMAQLERAVDKTLTCRMRRLTARMPPRDAG